jgi:zinc protease
VVKEERRLRVENPPFGRLFEVVLDKTYTTHPYRVLPIGSMADLNAATLEDVREFHRTYYRRLIYEKQMAVAADGQAVVLEDPGVFFFFTILQFGQKPEDGERELLAEVERLRNEPVSEAELAKSKNQLIASLVFGRQSVHDKANAIGNAAVVSGDLSLVNRQLAEYQKVSAADVQRVARTYFNPGNRTVVHMLPEAMRPAAQGSSEVKP